MKLWPRQVKSVDECHHALPLQLVQEHGGPLKGGSIQGLALPMLCEAVRGVVAEAELRLAGIPVFDQGPAVQHRLGCQQLLTPHPVVLRSVEEHQITDRASVNGADHVLAREVGQSLRCWALCDDDAPCTVPSDQCSSYRAFLKVQWALMGVPAWQKGSKSWIPLHVQHAVMGLGLMMLSEDKTPCKAEGGHTLATGPKLGDVLFCVNFCLSQPRHDGPCSGLCGCSLHDTMAAE